MESHLAIKNIAVNINNKNILNIESIDLEKGKILGLIGENGAGKSTLLRLLAFLEKPSKGEIYYSGKKVNDPHLIRKNISFIFQDNLLFKGSVFSNIAYPLKLRKFSKHEIINKVSLIIDNFSLNNVAYQDASTLSGGEARKVSIARSLVYEPDILFMDEPFNSLDFKIRNDLKENVFQYLDSKKITTVFVSHNLDEIIKYCDNLAIMLEGKIVEQGKVDDVLSKPVSTYANTIFNESGFIEAQVQECKDGITTVRVGTNRFSVLTSKTLNPGQIVYLSIRAEDIFISNNGAFKNSSVRNSFEAKIDKIEKMQNFSKLKLSSGFKTEASITKQSVEELNLFEGKKVMVGFKATAAKVISKH